ncbi:MAG: nucleotide exchange factor GrpE [Candidatus Krumholzibacteriota bacterium]|nr:nucleotide exchange factor GrpE [Candidatus Krumholzibacteriota bacterium]
MVKGDDIEIIEDMAKKRADNDDLDPGTAEKKSRRNRKSAGKRLAELLERKNEVIIKLENKLEETTQLLETKENKILRLAAEFENYKKRTRREWELHLKKANAGLLVEILGVLDDFERAFAAAEGEEDHFQSGIRMIYTQLMDVLKRSGLAEIEAEGMVFDPKFHEAVGNVESDEAKAGSVFHVVQKGYVINDQLLRPAKVIVVKEKNTDEPAEEGLENN